MFGRKKNATKSANLSVAIDNLTSQFTNMITTSEEAIAAKETKEREIAEMQAECNNLKAVSDRALMLSDKIANIFS